MSFEEWMRKEYGKYYGDNFTQEQLNLMNYTWNAAKEDSKPVAKIVERNLYNNKKEYSIIGFDGYEVAIRSTLEKAQDWAVEQGYKLK